MGKADFSAVFNNACKAHNDAGFDQPLCIKYIVICMLFQPVQKCAKFLSRDRRENVFSPSSQGEGNDFVDVHVLFHESDIRFFNDPVDDCLRLMPMNIGQNRQIVNHVTQ